MTGNAIARIVQTLPFQRRLVIQGMGWLGSLSLLSSGAALAQSPASELTIAEPAATSASDLAPTAPVDAPVPTAPESLAPIEPELAPDTSYAPASPVPSTVIPSTTPSEALNLPTPYIPAQTDSYSAPSTIVFSERSTGCQTAISTGQAISGICPPPSVSSPTAQQWSSTSGSSALGGSAPSVSVGLLNVSTSGVSVGGGTTTTSVRDYYQRTVRPPARLGNGNVQLVFPLAIPAAISSAFGWRVHPISGDQRLHTGTDLAAPMGTPVLAAYAGQVAIADFLGGYGLTVALDHSKGTQQTLYAHLSEVFVKPGEMVKQGDVIGRVGSTGNSTGPHLHFEFRQLTSDGWVAMDAGAQLEYAMAQLVKAMQVAQTQPSQSKSKS
ncbi:peptidoglycan DD-metalloendopeptidase family protein [Pantanalinema sp. GBBB05]|uniref:M23 family metallopeptidase n=1 Tax=Pantanalinema sp. GBBB05 TaxID=2604139 RepID=UPI001D2CF76A|nr:peptidoglycan DD-metalloendopeptidase family protein [Pantanalinema sp. GBBB05]